MTVINHKNISGITSITTPAGSDNLFTVHTNDTTERFRIDASGHQNISGIITAANFKTGTSNLHNTGLNIQDLDVDGHTNLDNVSVVGVTTFSADVSIADKIIHSGDTNTAIRFPAADTFSVETAGDERLRIESSGRIGINTTSSRVNGVHIYGKHLAINEGYPITWLQPNSSSSRGRMTVDSGGNYLFQFGSGNDEKLRFKSDGKVGINTASPAHHLDVVGNIRAHGQTPALYLTTHANTAESAVIRFGDTGSFQRGSIQYDFAGNSYLRFKMGGAGNNVERLNIEGSSGNITNTGRETSYITQQFSSNFAKIDLRGTNIANSNHYILSYGEGHANDHQFHMVNTLGDLVFRAGSSPNERLRITSAGRVGIGTDIPAKHFVVVDATGSGISVIGTNAGIYMGTHHTGGFQVNAAIARAASTNYHITNSVAGDLCIAAESTKNILFGTGPSAGAMHQRFKIKANGQSYFTGSLGVNVDVPSHNLHVSGTTNTSGARFNIDHTGTTVSGNTASGAFPHNVLVSNYNNSQPNNMATIGFDIPATTGSGAHANAVIVGQAENGNGNCSLQFWTESANTIGERLRITSDGKFGFNTVTPYAYDTTATTFEVKGSVASAADTEVARFRGGSDADGGTAVLRLTNDNDRGLVVKGGRESTASEYAEFGVSSFNGSYTRALKINAGGNSIFMKVPQIDNSTDQSSSENTFGHTVQRNWKKTIQPGKFQLFADYKETEGNMALMIQVSSDTGGHSGTSTYYWQGGYLPSSGYGDSWHRLLPSYTGYGHGDSCDNGLSSNAWEVLIGGAGVTGDNYEIRVAVHLPSGRTAKNISITISEMRRGMTFTDLSSNAAGDWSTQTDSGTDAQNYVWSKSFITTNTPSDAGSNYNYRRNYLSSNQHLYWYNGANQAYLHLNGSWTNASDIAYKKDIEEITYGIETVKQIKPRKYKHKGNDENDVGFIAQELETVVPEVVSGEEGGKGVSYGNLTAVLTKALQEAIVKIETLEAKVAILEDS